MSFFRRGCVTHHKHIDYFRNVKKDNQPPKTVINNKISHAKSLFHSWQTINVKHVHSNRLGISYDVSYQANGRKYLDKHNDRRMYRKRLYNLDFKYSDDNEGTNISIRQQRRFERSCRSVFNDRSQKPPSRNPATSRSDQLRLSKQHRFLVDHLQHINKPVMHLKYKKCSTRFDPTLYNFPIPYHLDRVQVKEHVMVNEPLIPQNYVATTASATLSPQEFRLSHK
ncbi:hypothetical protein RhiirC2_792034, partial [Rhizophagus irregularis]